MPLTQKAIDELKAIHKKLTGEELSDKEALEMGINLLNLFSAIYKPIPKKFVKDRSDLTD
jgi:hypothetical protein